MSMILDGSNGVTFNDASLQGAAASPYVLKNRIINGAMVIDQRNAGASVNSASGGGVYPVDRFEQESAVGGGVMAMQQSTIAPTGFYNSLSLTVSTADSSLAAGDRYNLRQIIEGYNVADLNFGTANAKIVTLSFWVRSSVTGTYCAGLRNGTNARSYVSNYTISSANTWEYKTITITGDTTGTWGATNGRGITVSFALASGSTAQTTADTWSAGEFIATSSQVNWMATIGNTFYITGVQLEQNTSATPFERRLYNQELANCQRYFNKSFNIETAVATAAGRVGDIAYRAWVAGTSGVGTVNVGFPTTMRTTPTITFYNPISNNAKWYNFNVAADSGDGTATETGSRGFVAQNSQVAGDSIATPIGIHYTASSEL
jgi:hypothetical protein